MLNVIITGASGMVGKGVLLECLDRPEIASVLSVGRSSLNMDHPKLKELIIDSFFELTAIEEQLSGYDACYFCLGTSAAGKTEEEYHKISYDLTLKFARALLEHNDSMTFCYVSGKGTYSTEKGPMMWARIKGKTENALLNLSFSKAYMFRPAYIHPMKGTRTKVLVYALLYILLTPLYPLLKRLPQYVTDTQTLGQAMINITLNQPEITRIESIDINQIGSN